MVVQRGEIWWIDLDEPRGSSPGFQRPVLVVQSNAFNRSRIGTVVGVTMTSNLRLADAPGNVFVSRKDSGLPKDSVANVSQLITLDRSDLIAKVRALDPELLRQVDRGLRLVLDL